MTDLPGKLSTQSRPGRTSLAGTLAKTMMHQLPPMIAAPSEKANLAEEVTLSKTLSQPAEHDQTCRNMIARCITIAPVNNAGSL